MGTNRSSEIIVNNSTIKVISARGDDYICLTDMVRNYGGDQVIYSWLRNRNTVEFLGIWEVMYNPDFKGGEFATFRSQSGLNSFHLTPKKWIDATGAIGIFSKAGRHHGGTYAHKDIAFEFGSWLSPEFKLLIIKEFQRLKEQEQENVQWDYRRFLTKVNYRLQTSAVKDILIPQSMLPEQRKGIVYAEEAEVINLALFGFTSKEWRKSNPGLAKKGNIRDYATIEQLTVLSNLESMNSMFISEGIEKQTRFDKMRAEAVRQLTAFARSDRLFLQPPISLPIVGTLPVEKKTRTKSDNTEV